MKRSLTGSRTRLFRRRWCATLTVVVVAAGVACTGNDGSRGRGALNDAEALRLVGAWEASFRLDPSTSVTVYAVSSAPVTGTIVFAEDHYGRVASDELGTATHAGVYDVDFAPFGFTSRDPGDVPVAVARLAPRPGGDSLHVVLSPGTPQFAVRMDGIIAGDSAAGAWHADSRSAGGGAGQFTMHRRR